MVWSINKIYNMIITEQRNPAGIKFNINYLNKSGTFFKYLQEGTSFTNNFCLTVITKLI